MPKKPLPLIVDVLELRGLASSLTERRGCTRCDYLTHPHTDGGTTLPVTGEHHGVIHIFLLINF